MRDTTKHRKDDLVPKGFLYAISIMVMLSLLVVFSASLFPGNLGFFSQDFFDFWVTRFLDVGSPDSHDFRRFGRPGGSFFDDF